MEYLRRSESCHIEENITASEVFLNIYRVCLHV